MTCTGTACHAQPSSSSAAGTAPVQLATRLLLVKEDGGLTTVPLYSSKQSESERATQQCRAGKPPIQDSLSELHLSSLSNEADQQPDTPDASLRSLHHKAVHERPAAAGQSFASTM